jgi:DNA polymerase III alpha subunit
MPESNSQLPEWPQNELLAHEKELLGFYVTGHPLTPFASILEKYSLANTVEAAQLANRSVTRLGGMITAIQGGFSTGGGGGGGFDIGSIFGALGKLAPLGMMLL